MNNNYLTLFIPELFIYLFIYQFIYHLSIIYLLFIYYYYKTQEIRNTIFLISSILYYIYFIS